MRSLVLSVLVFSTGSAGCSNNSGTACTNASCGAGEVCVDGECATAISYTTVHAVRPTTHGHEVVHRGLRYDDRLIRTPGGWLFTERYHQVLWSTTDPTTWPVPPFTAS